MGASWPITKSVKGYCILFLLLETGMLGVFLALDFFLFYVFWEVMLLPMYFLIGVWGGPRREYAAIKFFLYTLLGSVLMLIAILMLYYKSDLRKLSAEAIVAATKLSKARPSAPLKAATPEHTFNILALAQIGQMANSPFNDALLWGKSVGWWAFLLLFIGFAIKVPAVPLHTWLPDAHVEAPTPISMILAGVLLKMGGYGIIRICYPICPDGGYDLAYVVCGDRRVEHGLRGVRRDGPEGFQAARGLQLGEPHGLRRAGLGVWSANSAAFLQSAYWAMGVNGAMFQMIAHGISSAGMFFMVGVVYDRVHHRNLDQFGGLFAKMPLYSGLAIGIFFAGLGLPGLCGFIGEVLVTLSVWNFSHALAVISAAVVILTAGYILWTIQRVYLGREYKGPHGDHLTPITPREMAIAVPLLALAILFGVYPQAIFNYMTPSVNRSVDQLAIGRELKDRSVARHHGRSRAIADAIAVKKCSKMHESSKRLSGTDLFDDLPEKCTPSRRRTAALTKPTEYSSSITARAGSCRARSRLGGPTTRPVNNLHDDLNATDRKHSVHRLSTRCCANMAVSLPAFAPSWCSARRSC